MFTWLAQPALRDVLLFFYAALPGLWGVLRLDPGEFCRGLCVINVFVNLV
ncbi:hypothetical protein CHELA40_10960 [Chelatococcus asaccharovorans]|nr:hypothetical protein CHELA40_10960 [Chelatococcus asaccharovorans]CAH1685701.1 hypothetical protein CHELA17_64638 [Chelatococcus asaccharovorans]